MAVNPTLPPKSAPAASDEPTTRNPEALLIGTLAPRNVVTPPAKSVLEKFPVVLVNAPVTASPVEVMVATPPAPPA